MVSIEGHLHAINILWPDAESLHSNFGLTATDETLYAPDNLCIRR